MEDLTLKVWLHQANALPENNHLEPGFVTWIPVVSKSVTNISTLVPWNCHWLCHPFQGRWAWTSNTQVSKRHSVLRIGTKTSRCLKPRTLSTELLHYFKLSYCLEDRWTHTTVSAGLHLRQPVSTSALSSNAPGREVAMKRHQKPLEVGWLILLACYSTHGVRFALSILVLLRQIGKKPPQNRLSAARELTSARFLGFRRIENCCLVQTWPENYYPFLFLMAFICASVHTVSQVPLVPPWEASQQGK